MRPGRSFPNPVPDSRAANDDRPGGRYEMRQMHDGHRLTLSECYTREPLLALCLTGKHESPEVYLTPDDAFAMSVVLARFAFDRKGTD